MQTEPVWPIPQEMRLTGDALRLGEAVISLPGRPTRRQAALARLLADMIMDEYNRVLPIVRGRVPAAKKPIRIGIAGQGGAKVPADLPGPEGYLLDVTGDPSFASRHHRDRLPPVGRLPARQAGTATWHPVS